MKVSLYFYLLHKIHGTPFTTKMCRFIFPRKTCNKRLKPWSKSADVYASRIFNVKFPFLSRSQRKRTFLLGDTREKIYILSTFTCKRFRDKIWTTRRALFYYTEKKHRDKVHFIRHRNFQANSRKFPIITWNYLIHMIIFSFSCTNE